MDKEVAVRGTVKMGQQGVSDRCHTEDRGWGRGGGGGAEIKGSAQTSQASSLKKIK